VFVLGRDFPLEDRIALLNRLAQDMYELELVQESKELRYWASSMLFADEEGTEKEAFDDQHLKYLVLTYLEQVRPIFGTRKFKFELECLGFKPIYNS
jgi:hypothetical protein